MERFGRCSKCHEMTNVEDLCCNAGVWFEGSRYLLSPDGAVPMDSCHEEGKTICEECADWKDESEGDV